MRAFLTGLVLLLAIPASAQDMAAEQDVRIYATNVTSFNFNEATFDIPLDAVDNGALAGSGSSSLSLTTNLALYKITGELTTDYATGVSLAAQLDVSNAGLPVAILPLTPQQTLSATEAKDLATGMTYTSTTTLGIDYEATAPLSVGTLYDETREVVLTVVATAAL